MAEKEALMEQRLIAQLTTVGTDQTSRRRRHLRIVDEITMGLIF